jgi:hypothetical protein
VRHGSRAGRLHCNYINHGQREAAFVWNMSDGGIRQRQSVVASTTKWPTRQSGNEKQQQEKDRLNFKTRSNEKKPPALNFSTHFQTPFLMVLNGTSQITDIFNSIFD